MNDTVKLVIEIPKEAKQAFDIANDLKGGYYDHGGIIGKAIQNGIPLDENKREWIPVSERLPEIGQRVIVTYETFDEGLQVRETIYDKYGFLCGHGIAWMPLPEPYKAESEGTE